MEIGLTSTTLLNSEKFPVLVPNSLFSSQVGFLSLEREESSLRNSSNLLRVCIFCLFTHCTLVIRKTISLGCLPCIFLGYCEQVTCPMACSGDQNSLANSRSGQDSPYIRWHQEHAAIKLEGFLWKGGPLLFPVSYRKFLCRTDCWMQSQT